jgi:hypothetical protein
LPVHDYAGRFLKDFQNCISGRGNAGLQVNDQPVDFLIKALFVFFYDNFVQFQGRFHENYVRYDDTFTLHIETG